MRFGKSFTEFGVQKITIWFKFISLNFLCYFLCFRLFFFSFNFLKTGGALDNSVIRHGGGGSGGASFIRYFTQPDPSNFLWNLMFFNKKKKLLYLMIFYLRSTDRAAFTLTAAVSPYGHT